MQNSRCSNVHSISGSAGSLLSRWLGGAAGSVALKAGALFQGNGDDEREAPRDPLGLWLREAFFDGFGDSERDSFEVVRDKPPPPVLVGRASSVVSSHV